MSETKQKKRKRKPKRRVRWWLLIFPAAIIAAVLAAIYFPGMRVESQLRKLGYSKEEAEVIREKGYSAQLLENGWYSKPLAEAIMHDTLKKDYLPLYAAAEDSSLLTDENLLLYSRLADWGYEEDQLVNLFTSLEFSEMTPLLTFDYQWDENDYIQDCIENRGTNTNGTFELSSSYRTNYRTVFKAENPDSTEVLVNKTYYLDESYKPSDLEAITTEYAVDGMRMREEAANAVLDMCINGLNSGNAFFVASSYLDYSSINNSYEYFVKTEGQRAADLLIGKAGFCEFQTGLTCTFAATYEKYEDFRTTDCYKWLSKNAEEYGFIERYPLNREDITANEADASCFRYVGEELARKVKASGMTYDEYYCLFLNRWDDESHKPAQEIIDNAITALTGIQQAD